MTKARRRLKTWLAVNEYTITEAAEIIGCSRPALSQILAGKRAPMLPMAVKIERATRGMRGGRIVVESWLA